MKKNLQLTYDSPKDKYYLDEIINNQPSLIETFYGEWSLEEYLRDEYNFDDDEIESLYANMNSIA